MSRSKRKIREPRFKVGQSIEGGQISMEIVDHSVEENIKVDRLTGDSKKNEVEKVTAKCSHPYFKEEPIITFTRIIGDAI